MKGGIIEIVVGYLCAYVGRKALGLIGRAGSEVDSAIDEKLGQLYDWVKGKLTGRPSAEISLEMLEETPQGDKQQALIAEQLEEAISGDEAAMAQLQALVDELDRLRPPGVTISGLARGEDVYGKQVGLKVKGPLPPGTDASGEAVATTVHEGAENIGTEVDLRNPP